VVYHDGVEDIEKDVGLLMFDQAPCAEDASPARELRVADLFGVDAVLNDPDTLTVRALGCDTVEGYFQDGDSVLWGSGGEVLGELAERGEAAEVVFPVVAPDLVPGGK